MFILATKWCGGTAAQPLLTFDSMLPNILSTIVTLIKIGVPILLIVFGMLDLGKAVMAQKEDEIKKGQQTFIKRLIAAAIVFFVVFIVQIVLGLLVPQDTAQNQNVMNCFDCLINNSCSDYNPPQK